LWVGEVLIRRDKLGPWDFQRPAFGIVDHKQWLHRGSFGFFVRSFDRLIGRALVSGLVAGWIERIGSMTKRFASYVRIPSIIAGTRRAIDTVYCCDSYPGLSASGSAMVTQRLAGS